MNEGVECRLNAVNSRYIAASYFLENYKYYPECTVLIENSMLLYKFGRFFTVIFNSVKKFA